jgi:hypothetical protein
MRASDAQVLRLFRERARGVTIGVSAMRADLHRHTASKYLRRFRLPSEEIVPRTWRTRPDPFAADWEELRALLLAAPALEAKTLFRDLLDRRPDAYHEGQLRTFQRKVRIWRAQEGPERELFFPQEHRPGEAGQTDFTFASDLGVTLAGEPYPHLLCHFVLPCSNWGWATPCASESMAALSEGLQEALWRLGGVPEFHQTDNSSAATHDLRTGKRGFNARYLELVGHYGMKPRTTEVGEKEQNGDVEALHRALKGDLEQRLLLRGSRDFEGEAAYRAWLGETLERRNRTRGPRLVEERARLRPLPARKLPAWHEIDVRVGQGGTIRVMGLPYSVPPRLVGERVRVRVHETRIEILFAGKVQDEAVRRRGKEGHGIQYRHVVGGLLRKPGAFRCYRYRDALFPTETFRRAHERLAAELTAWAADAEYLRIVDLAAKTMEATVEAVLSEMLAGGEAPRFDRVRERVAPAPGPVPALDVPHVDLAAYDALLEGTAERAAS